MRIRKQDRMKVDTGNKTLLFEQREEKTDIYVLPFLSLEPDNKRILGIIEACVLVVCFDDPLPTKFNLATRTSHRASLSKRSSSLNMTSSQNTSQEVRAVREGRNARSMRKGKNVRTVAEGRSTEFQESMRW